MVLGGYARRAVVGEQTFVPPEDQGQAERTEGDTTSGCANQEMVLWRIHPLGRW
jgi:hypothetical protein